MGGHDSIAIRYSYSDSRSPCAKSSFSSVEGDKIKAEGKKVYAPNDKKRKADGIAQAAKDDDETCI